MRWSAATAAIPCVVAQDLFLSPHAETTPPHPDARSACASFNFSRKVELMHGFGWGTGIDGYTRNSGCGFECGRQFFRWDNGPNGFGDGSPAGNSTQWPSALNIAATWDPELAGEWGLAMGEEWWGKGTNFLEGPGMNVLRVPQNGRSFEYMSGEDPVLGNFMIGPVIDNMQKNAMAIAKHYILNNQETDRSGVNELVDEKTIMELYAPPFETAARHNVAGYMCAYNRINGEWACEYELTLKTMLKGYFNHSGFVVSDWGACHSSHPAVNAGLDIEMPNSAHFNEDALQAALDVGNITMDQINESCERIMNGFYALPEDKRYPCGGGICIKNNVSTPEHKKLARKIAAQSTVLLKNDESFLPLPKDTSLKIALIGSDASKPYTAGGGSGHVSDSNMAVSPLQAFERLGYEITTATGCKTGQCSMESDYDYSSGDHNIKSVAVADAAECCQLCAQESKCKFWTLVPNKHCFLKTSNAGRKVNKGFTSGAAPEKQIDLDGAASIAAAADIAIVFGSAEANEGRDRANLNLGDVGGCAYPQDQLIEAVAEKQAKTIVVMAVPGPILTDWRDKVAAIFCAFLPGEQYGNAIADLIFGDAMPQAKLPVTLPLTENDQGMSTHQWPGIPSEDFPGHNEVVYSEGQITGYRWYDKNAVVPAFPFGFGLTYGEFQYSDLKVEGRTISFSVSGQGCDTPQVYISFPGASADPAVPNKVLRYYQKTCENTSRITYTLTDRDVSTWDVQKKQWVLVNGKYGLLVAQASQGGAKLEGTFEI